MLQALQALVVGNAAFDELDRSRDVFCPFEAVGMVRQEVRHGHFLAHCLDPQRPHGFGAEVLRAFLRCAAAAQTVDGSRTPATITPLDVHVMDCERAQVRREWQRIDLLVIIPDEKLVVAIELKIDASEHSGQLGRYREIVKAEWPASDGWRHLFQFVTPFGARPSERDGADWLPVSLRRIAQEFDALIARRVGAEPARLLLASYLAMLRRHHVTDDRTEELAAKLWSQHREVLDFLMDRRPAGGSGVMGMLFERREGIARAMAEATGMTVMGDHSIPTTLRFAVEEWDALPDFLTSNGWTASNRLLLLEVAPDGDRNAIRVRFVLGPGAPDIRDRYYQTILASVPQLRKRRENTATWTRLGNLTLIKDLKRDDLEPEAETDKVIERLVEYAKVQVPLVDGALATLRN